MINFFTSPQSTSFNILGIGSDSASSKYVRLFIALKSWAPKHRFIRWKAALAVRELLIAKVKRKRAAPSSSAQRLNFRGRRPYIPAHLLVMSHQVFVDKMLSMLGIYSRGNRGQKKQDRYSGSVRRFYFSQKAILFSFTTICLRFC